MFGVFRPVMNDRLLAKTLERFQEQPGWAAHLPEDPSTVHTGSSDKARRFQRLIAKTRPFAGWSASHMCLMHVVCRFQAALPRRYLEIGVNEGLSVFALATALRLQKSLRREPLQDPLLDELVLADVWGNQFGGTGRGSHQHIVDFLASLNICRNPVTFLDGDSKKTVPAFLAARTEPAPFDAVYVDGDHSYLGARTDLDNVLPHVRSILFFDDMYHPAHCVRDRLLELHRALVERLRNEFYVFLNRRWFGFAAFIRKEVFDSLP